MIKLFMQCMTVISDRYKNHQKYLIMLFTIRLNKQKQEKTPERIMMLDLKIMTTFKKAFLIGK